MTSETRVFILNTGGLVTPPPEIPEMYLNKVPDTPHAGLFPMLLFLSERVPLEAT